MDLMEKARAKMLLKHAFFGTLVMSTPMKKRDDVPTMATDMNNIYYSQEFVDKLPNVDQVMMGLAHEAFHIALQHGMRRNGRNPELWNVAGDYAINLILKDSGFEMIDGILLDDQYRGMSADAIYDKLQKDAEQRKKAGGSGDPLHGIGEGSMGGDLRAPEGNMDAESIARTERSIQQRVAQAANVARMAGQLSGDLERLVGEILNPSVPWRELLRHFMTQTTHDDESWTRRNRRIKDYVLPGRWSERMGEIIFIGDTSGSIGNDELAKYAAETQSVAEQMNPEKIRVVWADTKVAGEQAFDPGEDIVFEPKGGGGTDMRVPLDYVRQLDPVVVVLCTDGYTPWPDSEPDYPLIVLCTTDADCPIGTVIRV